MQFTMADRKINAVMSTSAGRLFDAVSAILGIRRQSSFEGEASTALQFAAEAQHGGGGDPGGLGQFADGHVHHFVTIFNDVVVDHHLKIIETGDSGVGEHTHRANSQFIMTRTELYHAGQ